MDGQPRWRVQTAAQAAVTVRAFRGRAALPLSGESDLAPVLGLPNLVLPAGGSSHLRARVALHYVTINHHSVVTQEGFAAAYRAHARPVLVFLARRTYDPETALDLTAETFARAFESRRRFRGSTQEDQAAWLFGIARHVLARYLRRGKAERRALDRLGVEVPSIEPDDLARVVALAGLAELRSTVAAELLALPAAHRDAVRLRVVEELPYGDVAERLSITEPAARARVSRGLRSICRALEPAMTNQERLA